MKQRFPQQGRTEYYIDLRAWAAEVESTLKAFERRLAKLEKADKAETKDEE